MITYEILFVCNSLLFNEPLMVVNMNISGKGGTLVDTVKLPGIYTLDHSCKFISVSQVRALEAESRYEKSIIAFREVVVDNMYHFLV